MAYSSLSGACCVVWEVECADLWMYVADIMTHIMGILRRSLFEIGHPWRGNLNNNQTWADLRIRRPGPIETYWTSIDMTSIYASKYQIQNKNDSDVHWFTAMSTEANALAVLSGWAQQSINREILKWFNYMKLHHENNNKLDQTPSNSIDINWWKINLIKCN